MSKRHMQTTMRPIRPQKVAYTDTADVITNAVGAVDAVRIVCTTAAYYAVGKAPVATADDHFIPANTPYDISINEGEKVSAIRLADNGTLHVSELTQ